MPMFRMENGEQTTSFIGSRPEAQALARRTSVEAGIGELIDLFVLDDDGTPQGLWRYHYGTMIEKDMVADWDAT